MGRPLPADKVALVKEAAAQGSDVKVTYAPLMDRLPAVFKMSNGKPYSIDNGDEYAASGYQFNGYTPFEYHSHDPASIEVTLRHKNNAAGGHDILMHVPRAAINYAYRHDPDRAEYYDPKIYKALPDKIEVERLVLNITFPGGVATTLAEDKILREGAGVTSKEAKARVQDNSLSAYLTYSLPQEEENKYENILSIYKFQGNAPVSGTKSSLSVREYDGLLLYGAEDHGEYFGDREKDAFYKIDCYFSPGPPQPCRMYMWAAKNIYAEVFLPDFRTHGGRAFANEYAKNLQATLQGYIGNDNKKN